MSEIDFYKKLFSNRIFMLRTTYSITVLDAEMITGISRSSLNNWERNIRLPSSDGIRDLVTAYGVTTNWLFGIDEVVYTPDSLDYAEGCRSITKLIETVSVETPGMNSNDVSAIITPYLDFENRKKYSFHSRADILVFYLFLNGYNNYFSQNTNLKPSLQQISKYNSAQRGIIEILQTNQPISMELQQPGFEYKENWGT